MTAELDNIIWHALTSRQAHFGRALGNAVKFDNAVAPFAALRPDSGADYSNLSALTPAGDTVALFIPHSIEPLKGWTVLRALPLMQMIRKVPQLHDAADNLDITPLGAEDSADMIALTGLAKPGPFSTRTHELGAYFGIRSNGQLAAMAGERMKVAGHTEVSAVCTHPAHTGKGYAAALLKRVIAGIEARGETPVLHVLPENTRAIELYTRLGFTPRLSGYVCVIQRDAA